MNSEHVPLTLGGFQMNVDDIAPVAIAIIVGVFLMFGVRREFATFIIAAGVIGALLAR